MKNNDFANPSNKLKIGTYLGYGIGGFGEGIAYNLYYMFFMYFIVSIVGMSPAWAGIISFVSVTFDAITDPIIGKLSDVYAVKHGNRSRLITKAAIPLGILIALTFTDLPLPMQVKPLYFIVINLFFWFTFTIVDIPYISLGCEVTKIQNEQIKLRAFSTAFSNMAALVSMSGGILIIDFFSKASGSESTGYLGLGIVCGILTATSFLLCGKSVAHTEKTVSRSVNSTSAKGIFKEWKDVLSYKQYQIILIIAFLAQIIAGIGQGTMMFEYNLAYKLTSAQVSAFISFTIIISILLTAPVGWLSVKIGKKNMYILALVLYLMGNIGRITLGLTYPVLLLTGFAMTFMGATFWTAIYTFTYDIVDIDEFVEGVRREGVIVSINSFIMKIGIALGLFITGIIFQAFNLVDLNGPLSTEEVKTLMLIGEGTPAVAIILSLILISFYKCNTEKINILKDELEKKKQGLEYDSTKFKEIIKKSNNHKRRLKYE